MEVGHVLLSVGATDVTEMPFWDLVRVAGVPRKRVLRFGGRAVAPSATTATATTTGGGGRGGAAESTDASAMQRSLSAATGAQSCPEMTEERPLQV